MKDWHIIAIALAAAAGAYWYLNRKPQITPQNWQQYANSPNPNDGWNRPNAWSTNVGGLGWE